MRVAHVWLHWGVCIGFGSWGRRGAGAVCQGPPPTTVPARYARVGKEWVPGSSKTVARVTTDQDAVRGVVVACLQHQRRLLRA